MTDTIPYRPDDPAWVEARRTFLGASDVPAVLGLSPYKTPLDVWAEKTGLLDLGNVGGLATRLGHELEDLIARLWEEQNPDAEVRHAAQTIRSAERPWLAASTDREVGSDGLLECKLVGANTTASWDDGPPAYVTAQCLAQLAVTKRDWVDVCSLHAGRRWEHRVSRVERDDDRIAEMIDRLDRFWFDHVVTGVRPPLEGDPQQIRRTLLELHPGDDATPIVLDPIVAGDIETLKQAKSLAADLKRKVEFLENSLIALIGDATDAFIDPDEKPVYTYRVSRRTKYDLDSIRSGLVPGFTPEEIGTARRVLDAVSSVSRFRTLRLK